MPGLNSTRAEAQQRANHLAVQSYQVSLDLTAGDENFTSETIVIFSCNKPGYESFIDAVGRSVISATLNGQVVDASNYDGESIFLKNLAADNELIIKMSTSYSNTGEAYKDLLIQLIMRFIYTHKVRPLLLEKCILVLINQI